MSQSNQTRIRFESSFIASTIRKDRKYIARVGYLLCNVYQYICILSVQTVSEMAMLSQLTENIQQGAFWPAILS